MQVQIVPSNVTGLYCHGCDIILKLGKMLPLEKIGWKAYEMSLGSVLQKHANTQLFPNRV
jgi:hypothetical protein